MKFSYFPIVFLLCFFSATFAIGAGISPSTTALVNKITNSVLALSDNPNEDKVKIKVLVNEVFDTSRFMEEAFATKIGGSAANSQAKSVLLEKKNQYVDVLIEKYFSPLTSCKEIKIVLTGESSNGGKQVAEGYFTCGGTNDKKEIELEISENKRISNVTISGVNLKIQESQKIMEARDLNEALSIALSR